MQAAEGENRELACTRFAAVLDASEVLEAVMSRGRISAPNKLAVLRR